MTINKIFVIINIGCDNIKLLLCWGGSGVQTQEVTKKIKWYN